MAEKKLRELNNRVTFRATIRSGSWSSLRDRTFCSFLERGFEVVSSFLGDILRRICLNNPILIINYSLSNVIAIDVSI